MPGLGRLALGGLALAGTCALFALGGALAAVYNLALAEPPR